MADVLVFFVSDPVDDELAGALRERIDGLRGAHAWSGTVPGYFDDPAAGDASLRTTGGYVRSPARADLEQLWSAVVETSADLGVTLELQWREVVLGHVRSGEPDAGLRDAVLATGAPAS